MSLTFKEKFKRNFKKKYKRRTTTETDFTRFIKWCNEHREWIPERARDPMLFRKGPPFWIKTTYKETKEYLRSGQQWEDKKFFDPFDLELH